MLKSKKWIISRNDTERTGKLAGALRLSPVTASLLLNRGIESAEHAHRFLHPSLHQLSDPGRDPRVRAASCFLKDAIEAKKHITIYGDFDADGICACALLVRALKSAGASVDFYVPNRFDEGYGLNMEALEEIKRNGTDMVITVDCGTGACDEVERANRLGLEVIITDHHQHRGRLPAARYVLNPHLEDSNFGYTNLSGAGVAFKLAWALGQAFGGGKNVPGQYRDTLVDLLPLVAIGTVADMVPLEDENRAYVIYGLKLLPSTMVTGLMALMQSCRMAGKPALTAYNIGYQLAPRLNAAGRMSDAGNAIEMLITEDAGRASQLATELERHNRARRSIQRSASEEAIKLAGASHDIENCSCIVLSSSGWHPGVVGLVASRLAEHFSRPAFVFCEQDGVARGSARSIPGLHLFNAVSQCSDMLSRFGGHKGAAGLTLPLENMELFRKSISEAAAELMGPEPPAPCLRLDGEIALAALSKPVVEELRYLEPYGEGNPQPIFAARSLKLAGNPQLLGSNRNHLAFLARQNREEALRVIAFGKAEWLKMLKERENEPFSLAFNPQINTFNGSYDVELKAEDIQWENELHIEYV